MFRVYHSNNLDLLKDLFAKVVTIDPYDDPFVSEQVLVQSFGITQWLQIELAKTLDISANIVFLLPAKFIWNIMVKVLPGMPEDNVFTKCKISWRLMQRLPSILKEKSLAPLEKYLYQEDLTKYKLYQLSTQIADLFEQYILYRPDWLHTWERNELIDGLEITTQNWQAILWRDLISFTKTPANFFYCDSNFYNNFIQKLNEHESLIHLFLPKRVFIFGISAMPPIYLQVLEALSRHIDIHWFLLNPSYHYWGDIQDFSSLSMLQNNSTIITQYNEKNSTSSYNANLVSNPIFNFLEEQLNNPLLASWGKLGRDNLFLINQIESYTNDIDAFVEVKRDNLLHNLQADIFNLNNSTVLGFNIKNFNQSSKKRRLNYSDRSITLNVCYSIKREVEALQNHILALMEDDSDLQPHDIIVMVSNIDTYLPFIKSIFGIVDDNRYLPFSVSDPFIAQNHPITISLFNLLNLPNSRFTSSDILDLLEVPSLAKKFSINESKLCLLRQLVIKAGIRWGFDDSNMQDLSMPVTEQNTWKFGIHRMLLGYALESSNGEWQGILPYDECSSTYIAELVGDLANFLSYLNVWKIRLKEIKTLKEWQFILSELIDTFFVSDKESRIVLEVIKEQWQYIIESGIQVSYKQPIYLQLLSNKLRLQLSELRTNQPFLTGVINFCTFISMRSIPFKIICMLGMNDGIYPRTSSPIAFDLMPQQVRKGDSNCCEEDRYLFLETLIIAQCQLYISYIGRSMHDNTIYYPSILVKELMDYIAQSFYLEGDELYDLDISAKNVLNHLTVLHSRMPYAIENFQPGKHYQSFSKEWLLVADTLVKSRNIVLPIDFIQPLPAKLIETVSIEDLMRFWKFPLQAWFEQRLGVFFRIHENDLANNEPFVPKGLDLYSINLEMLNALIKQENIEQLYTYNRSAGQLPYGVFGKIFWQNQYQDMSKIASEIIHYYDKNQTWDINLKLDNVQLVGCLRYVQANGLLRWRPNIVSIKDGLLLWLEHLIYCALGGTGESRIYGNKKSKWIFKPLKPQEALFFLKKYLDAYISGLKYPLMLFNNTGGEWLKACFDFKSRKLINDEITQKKAFKKLLQAWEGSTKLKGDNKNPYIQRVIRILDPDTIQNIISASCQWHLPVYEAHYNDL